MTNRGNARANMYHRCAALDSSVSAADRQPCVRDRRLEREAVRRRRQDEENIRLDQVCGLVIWTERFHLQARVHASKTGTKYCSSRLRGSNRHQKVRQLI
jgi:hypothetical protein